MAESGPARGLFPELHGGPARSLPSHTGILPSQVIKELIRSKEIFALREVRPDQIQPASLDLR
ncbi:MAG: 2'-deoxycytidine 5'-triphosphate deaminase, partial [Alphaproteobacteria bacterium]